MNVKQIQEKLFSLADPKYKQFHGNLCPGVDNIIGVKVPMVRKLAKELEKEKVEEYLTQTDLVYYEEVMLQGMLIGLRKEEFDKTMEQIKKFVPRITNWAICDVFCAGLKITKKHHKQMWDFITSYLSSQKEYEIRFAVVMMLDYYITEEYLPSVLAHLDQIQHDGYYVKMAVAWAISLAYIRYPLQTMQYLKENHLNEWTYQKALQKIVESYRVSEQDKTIIRQMKQIHNKEEPPKKNDSKANRKKIKALFEGWNEISIRSYFQGYMGNMATDNNENPAAAVITVGSFCFFCR